MAEAQRAVDAEDGTSHQKDILLDKIASCNLKLGLNYHECEEASVSTPPHAAEHVTVVPRPVRGYWRRPSSVWKPARVSTSCR